MQLTRPVALSALALVAAGVLAACSSATATPSASPTASSAPSSAPSSSAPSSSAPGGATATRASERCTTSELSARLVPGSPGAGQRYATIVLTNTGRTTCLVQGYGGVGLYAADGTLLLTHQVRVPPAPQTVTLQPGSSVSSQLHWSAVAGVGDAQTGPCQPTAAALRVIPPDETSALSVPWTLGPVCEGGTIDQQAYTG